MFKIASIARRIIGQRGVYWPRVIREATRAGAVFHSGDRRISEFVAELRGGLADPIFLYALTYCSRQRTAQCEVTGGMGKRLVDVKNKQEEAAARG